MTNEIKIILDALVDAYGIMNYLGDILNGHDMCTTEDELATAGAFEKVRTVLRIYGLEDAPQNIKKTSAQPPTAEVKNAGCAIT